MKPIIFQGWVMCPGCAGSGVNIILTIDGDIDNTNKCIKCNGEGFRKPTWTEEILYKDEIEHG